MCGGYILQSCRARFNQNLVDPTCKVCNTDNETLEHFILQCDALQCMRQSILCDITQELENLGFADFNNLSNKLKIQMLLDFTYFPYLRTKAPHQLQNFVYQTRRLLYNLHTTRYKLLQLNLNNN